MTDAVKKVIIMIIRILLIIAGLVLIRYYIAPFISLRVINAGNIFGIGVGTVMILTGALWNRLVELIKQLWQNTGGKAFVSVFCVLIIGFTSLFFITLGEIISHSHYSATDQKVIIVLGCQIRGDEPSMTLKARCNAAAEYLNEHPDAVAIATGGQGADENLSEGQCIYNLLTEAGIDGSRIYIEDKSTNTDANISNALEIIESNGLSTDVAVATSEYHEYRASLICKKNGLNAFAVPSASTKFAKPTFFTREVFAVWAQWI
ncbi:MAG: YdcF family protein [Eubacterium sp.]|nr:YdcF family protein [Eubacterium sp.]